MPTRFKSLYPDLNDLNHKIKENEVTSERKQVDINTPAYTSPSVVENDQYGDQNNKTLAEDAQFNGGSVSKETDVIGTFTDCASEIVKFGVGFVKELVCSEDNPNHMKAPGSEHDEFIAFNTIDFNQVKGALKKAIDTNDYSELDKIVSNIKKSTQEENTTLDQPDYELPCISIDCRQENEIDMLIEENAVDMPIEEKELDCGELGAFCSSILNLNRKSVHHENARNKIIERASKQENGSKNYSVREIVLLAIAANDKLTEKYKDMLLVEKLDKDLEKLLIGVGGQKYIGVLLERLERELKNDFIMPWSDICKTLKMALSIENQECAKVILNKFKDTDAYCDDRLSCSPSTSSKLLHYAILNNSYTDVAKFIVEHGFADINSIDNNGYTPLHHAVICNNSKLVRLLIKGGANVDAVDRKGRTALHMAAAYGCKLEIAKLLVKNGADWRIKNEEDKTALDLIGEKAELQKFHKKEGYDEKNAMQLKEFLEGLDNRTPLCYAVELNNCDTITKLLKGGADINEKGEWGWTPLSRAIIKSNLELVKLLLDYKADVNIKFKRYGTQDGTHLYWAIQRAQPDAKNAKETLEIVKLLLDKGANIGQLELKEAYCKIDVMELLVRNGADITEEVLDNAKKDLEHRKELKASDDYVQRCEKVLQFLEGAFSALSGAAKRNILPEEHADVDVPQLKEELESMKSKFEKEKQERLSQQTKSNDLIVKITQLEEERNSNKQDSVNKTSKVTQLLSKNEQLQVQIQGINAELEKMKTQESKLREKEQELNSIKQELVNKTEELNSKSDKNTKLSASSAQSGKYSNCASAAFVIAGIFAVGASLTMPYLAICITLAVVASISLIAGVCCLYKANTALSDVKADQITNGANVGAVVA